VLAPSGPERSLRVAFGTRPGTCQRGVRRYTGCLVNALRSAGRDVVQGRHPRRTDVFHATWTGDAPLRPRSPTVVTLHDLAALKKPSEQLRGVRSRLRYLAVQRAHAVIVPTRAVAEDAVEQLGIPRERIHVVGEAADAVFRPRGVGEVAEVRERLGLPGRYLLWVGGMEHHEPRKRVAELVRTPRTLPLVLAGPTSHWTDRLDQDGVTLTGALSDDDLAAVYTGAHALVLPSEDEGFGLPPVEALACGTPVAACDLPVLREVLGDRAAFADPRDLAGLVELAENLDRPAGGALGRTWGDVARETWGVYETAVAVAG
jgi:glycosyltransferase involved in cell wall biosynthesis